MKYVTIDGNNIFFQHYPVEDAKGVFVILHGRGGSSASWKIVSELLQKEWYEVWVPDLPGFGKTEIKEVFMVKKYAEVVAKFIKVQKLENIFLLGHSNGGRISIQLVTDFQDFKIKKLFLNNAWGIKHPPTLKQKISKWAAKVLKAFAWVPGYAYARKVLYKLVGGHDYLNVKNEKIKQTFLNMIQHDSRPEITKIEVPTVLIRWEKDTYTPLSDGKLMHELISNSKLEILNGERHGIHLQNSERLVGVIKKYL